MTMTFRPARDDECPALSDLMLRSKSHWDYDVDFIEACRADLTITPAWLEIKAGFVAERDNKVVGFFGISVEGEVARVEHFFVALEAIGTGVGSLMWDQYIREAEAKGASCIEIESEPFAEAFYLSRGAKRIGEAPSSVFPGRMLPLLSLNLS
jgi:GNAT superfamily N-acetyltransferase